MHGSSSCLPCRKAWIPANAGSTPDISYQVDIISCTQRYTKWTLKVEPTKPSISERRHFMPAQLICGRRATDTFMSLYLLFPYFFSYCNDCCAIIKSWLFVIKHSIIWLKYFILYYLKVTCHCSLFVMLIMVYFYWLLEGYMPVPLFFVTLSVFFCCCCLCLSTWDYFIFFTMVSNGVSRIMEFYWYWYRLLNVWYGVIPKLIWTSEGQRRSSFPPNLGPYEFFFQIPFFPF